MGKRTPEVEQAIREAADRLLSGQPKHATAGRLSAVELAEEAGISGGRLYRDYEDLKDEFLDTVTARKANPPPATDREARMLNEITSLKDRIALLEAELRDQKTSQGQWKAAMQAAFRIVNVLEQEAHNLRVDMGSKEKEIKRLRETIAGHRQQRNAPSGRPEFTIIPGKQENPVDGRGDIPSEDPDQ